MQKAKLIGIDFFRAFAVIMIFLFHSKLHLNINFGILNKVISNGAVWMEAFFLVSGLVIYYQHHKDELLNYKNTITFYKKKFSIIYPAYLFIITYYLLFDNTIKTSDKFILLPMDLLMLQSTVSDSFMSLHHGGTWFISCLAFCYIITPSVIHYLKQLNDTGYIKLLCCLTFLNAYMFPVTQHMDYAGEVGIYDSVIYRGVEYIIGMIIAAMYVSNSEYITDKKREHNNIIIGLLFLVLLFAMTHGTFLRSAYLTLPIFIILIMKILVMNEDGIFAKICTSRVTKAINKIAYEIFLAQFFCFTITKFLTVKYQLTNQVLAFIVSLILALVIAFLMNKLISIPGKSILQKYDKIYNGVELK